jgi:hypothetical protein
VIEGGAELLDGKLNDVVADSPELTMPPALIGGREEILIALTSDNCTSNEVRNGETGSGGGKYPILSMCQSVSNQ